MTDHLAPTDDPAALKARIAAAAATKPKVGWWFNIAAQAVWVGYAVATRQWGFLASALAYTAAYVRLLCRAHRDARRINLGRRRLPPLAPNGCDECSTEAGERHEYSCPTVPAHWFIENVIQAAPKRGAA